MGPKKSDNANRVRRTSQTGLITSEEPENQQCSGKFAGDLDICFRDPSIAYPVNIPVFLRGHPPSSLQNTAQLATVSGASVAPSNPSNPIEERNSPLAKRASGPRRPSNSQSVVGGDNDNKSNSIPGQDPPKTTIPPYKTFYLVRDSECYRPKLYVDAATNETEPIEIINSLYMRGWQLDQRLLNILRKTLPLQEQLHTLNFSFVGLNEQTIHSLAEICSVIRNLKTVSLDGNPLAADHFYILIEREDLKIANLSLRFCKITDAAVERIARILGNMNAQNWKLLTLTLTGNQIGDNGAKSFAQALRYNRTLISLNLSSNFITDKGASALALVLRKIVLTDEEILGRRYLLGERYAYAHLDDMRYLASSPTLSIGSSRSRSGRDAKRTSDAHKRQKAMSMKTTDKRHRADSNEEPRPPSASRGDIKKGKGDANLSRSSSMNPRHPSIDPPRALSTVRGKKMPSSVSSSKKSISVVKEEDEDIIDEAQPRRVSVAAGKLLNIQMQHTERENPLLEVNEAEKRSGEIILKGNLVLLSLNLSRNYLTSTTVEEFLRSVQHQTKLIHFSDTASIASTTASLVDFSGLCRLELKGMNGISTKSPTYQTLESLLLQRSPTARFQQIKDREAKELHEQQTVPVPPVLVSEKSRSTSNVKQSNQRPSSRMKD